MIMLFMPIIHLKNGHSTVLSSLAWSASELSNFHLLSPLLFSPLSFDPFFLGSVFFALFCFVHHMFWAPVALAIIVCLGGSEVAWILFSNSSLQCDMNLSSSWDLQPALSELGLPSGICLVIFTNLNWEARCICSLWGSWGDCQTCCCLCHSYWYFELCTSWISCPWWPCILSKDWPWCHLRSLLEPQCFQLCCWSHWTGSYCYQIWPCACLDLKGWPSCMLQ